MWNLKVKGTDVMSYNQRFQELVLMCDRMFLEESDVVEKYVGGLPDMIHGSVKASKPKTTGGNELALNLRIKRSSPLMNVRLKTKESLMTTSRNTKPKQPFKRNNVGRAYTAGPGEKKPY
ncbi:hypothetical protein Tco_0768819 [Tanacetum coccineum]